LRAAVLGPQAMRRMVAIHAAENAADALISLSLVGSLFFEVSLEASRGRILLYLFLTVLPVALVAPLIGPALDRTGHGHRSVIFGAHATRSLLCVALVVSLTLPAFYPLVFAILLCRKAYSLGRTAIVPHLVEERLTITASAHMSRTGTLAGGLGTVMGGLIVARAGPEPALLAAALIFAGAALLASRLPGGDEAFNPTPRELRPKASADVRRAARATAVTRTAVGATTFMLAFAIKRDAGGLWVFGAALVAAGAGAFVGTMLAGRLSRALTPEHMIVLAVLGPGAVCTLAMLGTGHLGVVPIAGSIGLGASLASRAMDAFYRRVPSAGRGRVIARSEVGFHLANLVGAAAAVVATPAPRLGFSVLGTMLLLGGAVYACRAWPALRREPADATTPGRAGQPGAAGPVSLPTIPVTVNGAPIVLGVPVGATVGLPVALAIPITLPVPVPVAGARTGPADGDLPALHLAG
jgi:MFS family permease